jgi:ribosome-associated toxin RatA of RatAB toxin-antitoxin module
MRNVHVSVETGDTGSPRSATAEGHVASPVARVWEIVSDLSRYPGRLPMIHRVKRDGDRATVQLKFKIALFAVPFEFVVDVLEEHQRWIELRWVSGEPRDLTLRFDLDEAAEGGGCRLRATGAFDVSTIGWMAKYFLRHHPEIGFGIVPGVAVGLLEHMRRAAEEG